MNLWSFFACLAWAGIAGWLGKMVIATWSNKIEKDREERISAKGSKTLSDADQLRERLTRLELALNMKPAKRTNA